jgi:tetratricopeptide (TPR) repeat protein
LIYQFNPASLQEAQKFFEKSIAVDPNYGLAYSGLGSAHIFRFIAQTDPQDLELGINYLQKALAFDPDLAESHTWLTYALVRKQQFAEAIQSGLRAVELEENNFTSFYFLAVAYGGQADKGNLSDGYTHSARYFKKAVELQPNFQWSSMMLGFVYMLNGQPHEAQRHLDKAVEIEDSGKFVAAKAVGALTMRGNLALRQQQLDLAQDLYQRSLLRLEGVQHVYREYLMALSYCGLGQIHFNRRNYDKVVDAYQNALEVIKSHPQALSMGFLLVKAHLGMAKAYYHLMVTREVKSHFEAALPLFTTKQGSDFSYTWEGTEAQMYYDVASYYALMNHPQETFVYLHKALAGGWADLPTLESDDCLSLLRDAPEYQKIVQDLKARKPLP